MASLLMVTFVILIILLQLLLPLSASNFADTRQLTVHPINSASTTDHPKTKRLKKLTIYGAIGFGGSAITSLLAYGGYRVLGEMLKKAAATTEFKVNDSPDDEMIKTGTFVDINSNNDQILATEGISKDDVSSSANWIALGSVVLFLLSGLTYFIYRWAVPSDDDDGNLNVVDAPGISSTRGKTMTRGSKVVVT